MFRRVAFNVAVANRDDHLRNHGFVLHATGWRLAPAFDVNPSPKQEHVLSIDDFDKRSDLSVVRSTAFMYGLGDTEADAIIDHVVGVVDGWEAEAKKQGLSPSEILEMTPAFTAGARYREKQVGLAAAGPPPRRRLRRT